MSAVYRASGDVKGALAVAALLAVISAISNDPMASLGLMSLVVPLVMYAMTRLPLRHSMLGLMFFALTLPNPAEGFVWAPWTAPFEKVGWLLLTHWNTIDRSATWLKPAVFSGLDLFFAFLGLVAYQRRKARSKYDFAGAFPRSEQMRRLTRISFLTTLFVWLSGMVRGGSFGMSLWQVNSVIYLPVIFLLFQEAIRGPQDFPAIMRVLCGAAIYRSLLACYIINAFPQPPDEMGNTKLPYATAHADSMLFADVFAAVVILVLERLVKRGSARVLWVLPIVALGMVSNNRRLVWVHLGISMLTLYFITADNPIKQKIRRAVFTSAPVALGYVAAGWGSEYGTLFKPVRMLRSVIDTKSDKTGSSFWRELENFNLISTMKNNMVFGTGFGHGFEEVVELPAVAYDLERFLPHNSVLGLWAFCGVVGYAGITLFWVAGVYYAMRAYRNSKDAVIRAGALASVVGVLVYIMHCWGDLGLSTWTGVFTAGLSLAVGVKAEAAATAARAKPRPSTTK